MKKLLVYLGLFLGVVSSVSGQSSEGTKSFNLDKSGLALEGFDPVAYFNVGRAKEGKKEIYTSLLGATYRFSSIANREQFKANPSKYLPQYGGWCAYAMGKNAEKVSVDPETFKVLNGKLYLFYNRFFNNTLKEWNKNENVLKSKADQNWSKINP
ncbi:YHS domain-containing (seleno)protein [Pedobacter gandavensis]|uniref:YHS domain-containing (seleno)protein n=1 Tax=Pedobacter gandavensis TaxID=2679963 RepID=UPI00292E3879|nr:YHS domain-containing (seleno)protein [Pedobacter gandavensis]